MKEERLKILKMLDDKKINVDEAIKLLDSLKAFGEPGECDRSYQSVDMEDKLNKFSQSVDNFAKDFSDKMSSAFKDMEPKLRQATKTVVEKTAGVVDDISKSLNESLKSMEDRMEEQAEDCAEDCNEEQVENTRKEEGCCCKEEGCCCNEQPESNEELNEELNEKSNGEPKEN